VPAVTFGHRTDLSNEGGDVDLGGANRTRSIGSATSAYDVECTVEQPSDVAFDSIVRVVASATFTIEDAQCEPIANGKVEVSPAARKGKTSQTTVVLVRSLTANWYVAHASS
jgi:hypothetical protein